ncbi:Ribulose-phosphate 3-epimerase [subsurface metagenome]|nr:ribulose-phosphate 3-epimerase [Hadesarchaea archaeon]
MGLKIAASLLSADFSRLGEEVKYAEKEGVDLIHWDIMDGHFVPNITFGPAMIQALRDKTKLPFNAHLMIENPYNFIEKFAEAGSDIISVHAETCDDLQHIIRDIKGLGVKVGVALNPATPLNVIEHVLDNLDFILIMTVNPGFGGQKFISAALPKVREARQMVEARGLDIDIGVDGGINEKTAPLVVKDGANVLVMGFALYGRETKLSVRKLKDSLCY